MLELRTFGGLSVQQNGVASAGAGVQRKTLALLALLAASKHGLSRDKLIAYLWPERDTEHGRSLLKQACYALRRDLHQHDLFLGATELRLNPAVITSDVQRFADALENGDNAAAAALYRGPFLDGFFLTGAEEFERWGERERARLAVQASDAMVALARAASTTGRHEAEADHWRQLARMDPFSTRAALGVMRALDDAGERLEALQYGEAYQARVRQELGAEPAAEVVALIHELGQRTTLTTALSSFVTSRSSTPVVPKRFVASKPVGLALAAAAVALISAGLLLRPANRFRFDPKVVAVMPFNVLGEGLDIWKEGMVDVLSRNLDGAGDLRAVPPSVITKGSNEHADRATAFDMARRTGAGLVVFGTLLNQGGDSVRLSASVFDAATGKVLAEFERGSAEGQIGRLADSLTVAVLDQLAPNHGAQRTPIHSVGTRSLTALKAFLLGEQYVRRAAWDSAIAAYERAVEADSTFALALRRLGMATEWHRSRFDAAYLRYKLRAGSLNIGLAPRDSLLVLCDSLMSALADPDSNPDWWSQSRRLFSTLQAATSRYSADPEVWYEFGDAIVHYGHWRGFSAQQALTAFDRAISLDSSFAPAYIHPLELGMKVGGPSLSRRYADAYLARSPDGPLSTGMHLFVMLLDPRKATSPRTVAMLGTASRETLLWLSSAFRLWPDSAEIDVMLLRHLVANATDSAPHLADVLVRRKLLATQLSFRGHVSQAYRLAGTQVPYLFAQFAYLGLVPNQTAAAAFDRWLRVGGALDAGTGLPWFAERGDTTSLRLFLQRSQAMLRSHARRFEARLWTYGQARAQAYLALARQDSNAAMAFFAALPDSLCGGCYYSSLQWDDLTYAELLAARHNYQRALDALELQPRRPDLMTVMNRLMRARLQEQLGHKEAALADYRFVINAWRHADPNLEPQISEARVIQSGTGSQR